MSGLRKYCKEIYSQQTDYIISLPLNESSEAPAATTFHLSRSFMHPVIYAALQQQGAKDRLRSQLGDRSSATNRLHKPATYGKVSRSIFINDSILLIFLCINHLLPVHMRIFLLLSSIKSIDDIVRCWLFNFC